MSLWTLKTSPAMRAQIYSEGPFQYIPFFWRVASLTLRAEVVSEAPRIDSLSSNHPDCVMLLRSYGIETDAFFCKDLLQLSMAFPISTMPG